MFPERVVYYLDRVRPEIKWVLNHLGLSTDLKLPELFFLGLVTQCRDTLLFTFPLDIWPWIFWLDPIPPDRTCRLSSNLAILCGVH